MSAGKQHLVQVIREISLSPAKGLTFIQSQDRAEFFSYQALYEAALKVLFHLQQKGIKPKDEVVFQVAEEKAFLICFWACLLGGMIPVPLSMVRNQEHLKKLLAVWHTLHHPALVIAGSDLGRLEEKAAGVLPWPAGHSRIALLEGLFEGNDYGTIHEPAEDDIAFIQFSSGSTGRPKGVTLTHRNLITNIDAIAQAAAYSENDVLLSWMPLTHDMGMIGFHLNPLYCGISQVLIPVDLFVKQPAIWLDTATAYQATVLSSPNFGYRHLLKHVRDWDRPWDLSKVRIIYNGAEPISEQLTRTFIQQLSAYQLSEYAMCPVYGLAEASVAVSISNITAPIRSFRLNRHQLQIGDRIELAADDSIHPSFMDVGRPINNCAVCIMNSEHQQVPEGLIGHICIKGPNVTAGYYNDPAASAEVIDANGWLNTGDLGFMLEGSLYITGRAKDIIFFNGQNFYPHDIEREAEAVEGIELNKIAVAGHFNHALQAEEIIAFILYRGSLEDFASLARALKAHLNPVFGFEISKVIPIKEMPKTTSGKIQRFRLLEKYRNQEWAAEEEELALIDNARQAGPSCSPANDTEQKILAIWEAIFEKTSIGVLDRFFEIGGNSLKAAALAMKFQQEFRVHLPVEKLYEWPTIRALGQQLSSLRKMDYQPIPQAAPQAFYPLSSAQKRLYYAWKLDPQSIAYNVPTAFTLRGKPVIDKLVQCLERLVQRHDVLRMSFGMMEEPVFNLSPEGKVNMECIGYESVALSEKLTSLVRPFNLHQGPLYRCCLLKNEEATQYVLFLDVHHIICDGQSVYHLLDELLKLYAGEELPATSISYRDFVLWERQQAVEQDVTLQSFWTRQLSGELPVLDLLPDFARPPFFPTAGKRREGCFDQQTTQQLYQYAANRQLPLHDLLFALYQLLLFKFTGATDIITGIPVGGRSHPDLQGMPGMFVNNLPIRTGLDAGLSFENWVQQVSATIQEALQHQQLPFDRLLSLVEVPPHPGRNPLFDTMFLYQSFGVPGKYNNELSLTRKPFDPGFARFDCTLEIVEGAGNLQYTFEYATRLYSDDLIVAMSASWLQITTQALNDPALSLAAISPLDKVTHEAFIYGFNNTAKAHVPGTTVLSLFESQAIRTPDAIAIQYKEETISYKALNEQANHVAQALRKQGVQAHECVGICLPRSPQLLLGLLGIWKAGCAYLPIDAELPADRIRYMLEDSRAVCWITHPHLHKDMAIAGVQRFDVDELAKPITSDHQPLAVQPGDLAYVIYTSGTSGRPKGVMVSHQALHNYVDFASEQYVQGEQLTFALHSSISFDLTVTSLFTPLTTGNTILLYEEDGVLLAIENVVRDNRAGVVKLTPSHLKLLRDNGMLAQNTSIRRWIVGGEALDSQLARDVYQIMEGRATIFNEYGPTEATVGCMIYTFDPADGTSQVPIGTPINNLQIYLLDPYLQPVPAMAAGDMYIAGTGLAAGYWRQEELTVQKFISNPFIPGQKMYCTGDRGRRLGNGQLEFLGRKDLQVKINGHRIELNEISHALQEHPAIQGAIVVQHPATGKLQAYYTIKNNGAISEPALRQYLAGKIPYYMMPVSFTILEHIPLTPNGKVDMKALPAVTTAVNKSTPQRPVTSIEQTMLEVWEQVLGKTGLTPDDNFFALGGDSIMASQIASKLFAKGVYIKVKDLLTLQAIEQVALHAQDIQQHKDAVAVVAGEVLPTPIQAWFFRQQFAQPGHYTQSVLLRLHRAIDHRKLRVSFDALLQHHDTLRLCVHTDNETLFYNNREGAFEVTQISLGKQETLPEVCNTIRASFDIRQGPLIKATVLREQEGTAYLFITAHHLVIDGVSWRILLEDLYRVYYQFVNEVVVEWPAKTASFQYWSRELYRLRDAGWFEEEIAYWKEIEDTHFVMIQHTPVVEETLNPVNSQRISLDAIATHYLLTDANRPYNTDVSILLNVALVMALHAWGHWQDMVIFQEHHGRELEDTVNLTRTIGWFTAMYPVKLRYEEDMDLLIKATKESLRQVPNHGIGYGVYKYLGAQTDRDSQPEIRINYLGQFGQAFDNELFSYSHQYTGEERGAGNHPTARLDLNALVMGNQLQVDFSWCSQSFSLKEMDRFVRLFDNQLNRLLDYVRQIKQLQYTPSDFSAAGITEDDLKILLG
ncbi:amino acid adenylation domain-containing protein [Paraflavitalea soli]|uniref:Amino acid adenylation domain-containing protein n=1 Tax=Paraflavitalea soli TaxID=2315862 RepID=A0A3B7MH19_9BACT|nr:non-ribosomal peptide synthetase [Paraflavitalea soli]AXY73682.1 amino acid adenylation domain-containing protein [Paraflavitalea soli]